MLHNYSQSWRMKISCVCRFIGWEGMVEPSIVPFNWLELSTVLKALTLDNLTPKA